MKKFKRIFSVMTAIIVFSSNVSLAEHVSFIKSLNVYAEDLYDQQYIVGDNIFIYNKYNGDHMYQETDYIYITGYIGTDSFITIPDTIDGCLVKYVNFGHNSVVENDNSDLIISITLPDTVEDLYNCPNLMQIRGNAFGNAINIAKSMGVSFYDLAACGEYGYLEYLEENNNIIVTGINFSPTIEDYIIPDTIDGKKVTELRIPTEYYISAYIPDNFSLRFLNPEIIFSDPTCWDMWSHCSRNNCYNGKIYGYPGSSTQVFANQYEMNFVPLETNQEVSFDYEISFDENNEECTRIWGIRGDNVSNVVIPETIEGKPVRSLNIENSAINKIFIPDSVQYISSYESNPNVCFYVNNDSYARRYAEEHNIMYKLVINNEVNFDYDFYYETRGDLNEQYAVIYGIEGENVTDVEIPEVIDGIPVIELRIFNKSIKNISIPDCIEYIETYDIDPNICFYVNNGSYALEYAKQHNIIYKYIDLPDEAYFSYAIEYHDSNISTEINDPNNSNKRTEEVIITGYFGLEKEIVIPDKMYGLTITTLDLETDDEMTYSLTIPSSIDNIRNIPRDSIVYGYRLSGADNYANSNYGDVIFVPLDDKVNDTDYKYELYEDHAEIVSCTKADGKIAIPSEIRGRKVTKIRSGAFTPSYSENSIVVYIPESIEYIAEDAFDGINTSKLLIKSESDSFTITYAKEHNIRYEEIRPSKWIGSYWKEKICPYYIETREDNSQYVVLSDNNNPTSFTCFKQGFGSIVFPDEIEGISVETLIIGIVAFPNLPPWSLTIPSSVRNIEFSFSRNTSDYGDYGDYSSYSSSNMDISDYISEIIGEPGSYAEEYANCHNIPFKCIDKYISISYIEIGNNDTTCFVDGHDVTIPEQVEYVHNLYGFVKTLTILGRTTRINNDEILRMPEEVKGYKNSPAETWANQRGIKFTPIPECYNNTQPELTFNNDTLQKCDISAIDITLPEDCLGCNDDAFNGCSALKSIYIPYNMYIQDSLFKDCINLREIRGKVGSEAEAYALSHNLSFVADQTDPRYIVCDLQDGVITGIDPLASTNLFPDILFDQYRIRAIGDGAFREYYGQNSIVIPETIEEVCDNAFINGYYEPSNLTVILPKNMERVNNIGAMNITVLNPDATFADNIRYLYSIEGYYGSTAHNYAKANGINFTAILDETDVPPDYLEYEICYKNGTYPQNEELYYDSVLNEPYVRILRINDVEECVIPETIEGIPVREISNTAFDNCLSIKSLTINAKDVSFDYSSDDNIRLPISIIYGYISDDNSDDYFSAVDLAQYLEIPFIDLDNPVDLPEGIKLSVNNGSVSITEAYPITSSWTVPDSMYGLPITDVTVSSETLKELIVPENVVNINISCPYLETLKVANNECQLNVSYSDYLNDIYAPIDNTFAVRYAAENRITFHDINGDTIYVAPIDLDYWIYDDVVTIYDIENNYETVNLIIPESIYGYPVVRIDALIYNSSLKTVEIPASVTEIEQDVFESCYNLEKIIIKGNPTINRYICNKNVIIQSIVPGNALEYAATYGNPFIDMDGNTYGPPDGFYCQYYDNNIVIYGYYGDEQSIIIPDEIYTKPVTIIDCFEYNKSLKTVEIPVSVTNIGYYAFVNCVNLEKIIINGNPTIEDSICNGNVIIQSIIPGNALEYAITYRQPFMDMDGNIYGPPDGLSYYYDGDHISVIDYCGNEQSLIIPDEIYTKPVTRIDSYAFDPCESLKSVVIPESVTEIGEEAFIICDNLERIIINGNPIIEGCICNENVIIQSIMSGNAFEYAATYGNPFIDMDGNTYGPPDGISYSYEGDHIEITGYYGNEQSVIIPEEMYTKPVTVIGTYAFGENESLKTVVIPESVTEIRPEAFMDCYNLEQIVIPESVTTIGEEAIPIDTVIMGYSGSTAEDYAIANGNEFINIDIDDDNWDHIDWHWENFEENGTVTAELRSSDDETYSRILNAYVKIGSSVAPTCTEDGYKTYIAEVIIDGITYSDSFTEILDANGHSCYVSGWTWSEDRTSCEAELKCSVCNEIIGTVQTTVRHEVLAPTCIEEGYDNYIAEVTINNTLYSDSNNRTIPANGHDFYADSWTWSDDYTHCDVVIKCHNCDAVVTDLNVSISSEITKEPTYDETGTIIYTGVCIYQNLTFNTTNEVEIPVKERTDISSAKVLISATSFDYDGTEKTVNVNSVKLNGVMLKEGVDYEVTGNKATESGDYTLIVTGKGAYKGTVSKYWKIVKHFKVTYTQNGNKKSYIYTENAFCNIKANEIDGKTFSHWKLTDSDTILSYNESYTFRVVSNTSLEAIYVDSGEEIVKEPVIAVTSVRAFNNRIYYEITRDIPENYTVISNGILYGTSTSVFVESDDEGRDNNLRFIDDIGSTDAKEKVHVGTSSINNNKGYYSYYLDIGANTDRPIYLRGYVIVKDDADNVRTLYTDIVGKTYNQILGN